jgi:hypothetical protein
MRANNSETVFSSTIGWAAKKKRRNKASRIRKRERDRGEGRQNTRQCLRNLSNVHKRVEDPCPIAIECSDF